MTHLSSVKIGSIVHLRHEDDCIVPPGSHVVSKINPDGSFHVGGRTAVWPRRVEAAGFVIMADPELPAPNHGL